MTDTMNDSQAAEALDDVADEAEATAVEQKRLGRSARAAASDVRGGARWSELAESGLPQRLLDGAMAGSVRLSRAASRLRMATVAGLLAEGLSTRQIGRYLRISHQRVSSLQPRRDI
jgi:DNA-binding NarL/FixJ family response regulator